jgi:hypothetical protein
MYLLYLCKIQVNGRTPSTTACLRRLKYSLLRCTTHVVHLRREYLRRQRQAVVDGVRPLTCILHKYKRYMGSTSEKGIIKKSTAVHHRRRPAFAVLSIPFSDVLPMYLLYLCKMQVNGRTPSTTACLHKYKRYMGSTSEKGIIKTAKAGRRRWCTAVDLSIPFSDVLPMYLLYLCKMQVNGRTPSTTACLRRCRHQPTVIDRWAQ